MHSSTHIDIVCAPLDKDAEMILMLHLSTISEYLDDGFWAFDVTKDRYRMYLDDSGIDYGTASILLEELTSGFFFNKLRNSFFSICIDYNNMMGEGSFQHRVDFKDHIATYSYKEELTSSFVECPNCGELVDLGRDYGDEDEDQPMPANRTLFCENCGCRIDIRGKYFIHSYQEIYR